MSEALEQVERKFEQQLVLDQHITQSDMARAVEISQKSNTKLDRILLRLGLIEEAILLRVLSRILEIEYVESHEELGIDQEQYAKLGHEYCATNILLPANTVTGKRVVLTNDPANMALSNEVSFFLDHEFDLVAASAKTIRDCLRENRQHQNEAVQAQSADRLDTDLKVIQLSDSDGPVIRYVSSVLDEAVARSASDVHFEAQNDGLRIRFRMNGLLKAQTVNQSLSEVAVLARVKVMAGLNVSERRLPQDGRISKVIGGRNVDFRVSSIPTSFGESIVCRILDPGALRLGWNKLGFDEPITQKIIETIEKPNGLFLVTGPTGSGKSTTLYTALSHLNKEERKIVTIEDPIEYNLAGVEQVQVHDNIGMTFARALRAFLRHDPDVIMVGEIRDEETAAIACRAAQVGRLVLSTLHTNHAAGATTRLVDLGVPDFLVRDVLIGTLGQRLIPTDGGPRKLDYEFVPGFS